MDAVLVPPFSFQVWEHQRGEVLLISFETPEQLLVFIVDVSVPQMPLLTVVSGSKQLHVLNEPLGDLLRHRLAPESITLGAQGFPS